MLEVECLICKEIALGQSLEALEGSGNVSGMELLNYCIDIQVPKVFASTISLCVKCWAELEKFYKFKMSTKEAFDIWMKINLGMQTKLTTPLEPDAETQVDCAEWDIKCEYFDVGDDFDTESIKEDNSKCEFKKTTSEGESFFKDYKQDLLKFNTNDEETDRKETKTATLVSPKSTKASKNVCHICGLKVRKLKLHIETHTQDVRLSCKICSKIFSSRSSLKKHKQRTHETTSQWCAECNKSFKDLASHVKRLHRREGYSQQCEVCGARCLSRSSLRVHKLTHGGSREHACAQCGALFTQSIELQNHVRRVHNKEKSFLCDYCSKGFFSKYALTVHIRSHTKERPETCLLCGKRFMTRHSLHVHMRRHDNLRAHVCPLCRAAFVTRTGLKAHSLTHSKEKKYKCGVCDAYFLRSDHRNRHQRTRHKLAPAHAGSNNL